MVVSQPPPLVPSWRPMPRAPDLWELAHRPDPWAALTAELKPPLDDAQAQRESLRCLLCGGPTRPAPCVAACPTGIDIPGFIAAIADGRPHEAAERIFAANPLGGSCARVCPTEVLCEGACVLERLGQRPVDIGRLQRYATDRALPPPPQRPAADAPRVAVVGAGPAGLAGAAELARRGAAVTVYERRAEAGGLVRYAIAPYRLLRDPLPQEVDRLRRLGVGFRFGQAVAGAGWQRLDREYEAVLLAVGLGGDMPVHYPGDDLAGVWRSLPFIEAVKRGALPEVGRRVAVVGGGNTAVDVARLAVRLGARQVTVLYRRSRREMPAYAHEVEQAETEGVHFAWLSEPVQIQGDSRVKALVVRSTRLLPAAGGGRPQAVPVEGSETVLAADTVVLALGQAPPPPEPPAVGQVGGRVAVDSHGQTRRPGYFAAGDAVNGGATVVEAVREGLIAARGIARRLSLPERRPAKGEA